MNPTARRIVVTGRVQGVGYRPFVYVTAQDLGITGSVLNGSGKVFIHAEGSPASLDRLEEALIKAAPPLARPALASSEPVTPELAVSFEILASDSSSEPEIHVPPDLFTCDNCVEELNDPGERRHAYPFINCTQCGPRYTIITAMPYDRPNTSMAAFPLCDACRAEYESPRDRRFHAQPLACPVCGPQLEFSVGGRHAADKSRNEQGLIKGLIKDTQHPDQIKDTHHSDPIEEQLREDTHIPVEDTHDFHSVVDRRADSVLPQAIRALQNGKIIAVKGVGGYHLVCDADNDDAVNRLRTRKHRPHKPLAVMFPIRGEDGLDHVRDAIQLNELTAQAIADPARPIVLVRKRTESSLSKKLAPGLRELGVFLPYSPLHHQLLKQYGKPIVATSGNISGEPVITDNDEAEQRLADVADAFLHHNRPIVRPADDPVIRPIAGQARVVRLGRGIAPLELQLPARLERPILATGGHMKVTVALAWDDRVVISPHIGDLDSPRSNEVFTKIIKDIQELYDVKSQIIICDLHPGYASSRWAQQQSLPVLQVQHHAAHASSLAGEHPEIKNWLVFTWDGVGYGKHGTLWGGEALAGRPGAWQRQASFRPFSLVGGDKAGREPWRSAAALMWAENKTFPVGGRHAGDRIAGNTKEDTHHSLREVEDTKEDTKKDTHHSHAELRDPGNTGMNLAHKAWSQNINTFQTTAAGRLFDAAAALVLGRNMASFEGQGPMELEHIAASGCEAVSLPLAADENSIYRSNWAPLLDVLSDRHIPPEQRAGIFHESMAQALFDQTLKIRENTDFEAIGLSGGVFQNRKLCERVTEKLQEHGIEVRLHRDIPANDGGLCFGQIIEAQASLQHQVTT